MISLQVTRSIKNTLLKPKTHRLLYKCHICPKHVMSVTAAKTLYLARRGLHRWPQACGPVLISSPAISTHWPIPIPTLMQIFSLENLQIVNNYFKTFITRPMFLLANHDLKYVPKIPPCHFRYSTNI